MLSIINKSSFTPQSLSKMKNIVAPWTTMAFWKPFALLIKKTTLMFVSNMVSVEICKDNRARVENCYLLYFWWLPVVWLSSFTSEMNAWRWKLKCREKSTSWWISMWLSMTTIKVRRLIDLYLTILYFIGLIIVGIQDLKSETCIWILNG
jgi:hypothetical protein